MSFSSDAVLVVRARRIHTPTGTVEALLIRHGRVVAAGGTADIPVPPGARELDLGDVTITAGFTDAHVHLVEWALARRQVELAGTDSPAEAAARVAEAAGSSDGWIRGRGWNPHRWREAPHRAALDAAAAGRPVLLQSHDMHTLWASSTALERAGITASTPDPEGGRIERDGAGEPTGVVRDNAMPLLYAAAPEPSERERRDALLDGQRALHRFGVVGVHTVEPDSLSLLESIRAEGRLRIRVLQHLPLAHLDEAIRLGLRSGFGGDWLRIGGIKMFLDGALGSLTALLREPYEGTDDDRGISTLPPEDFRDAVRRGSAAGLAMTVHAIGDAAVDLALDVLAGEEAILAGPVPHRIEHAQLVGPDRLEDVGERARKVVCSVQPAHVMDDWRASDRHWGERSRWAFAFHALERAGFPLALGSDAPVVPPDPRLGLYAAVTRQDLDGQPAGGWIPEERLSMERAWSAYTVGSARAAGDPRQGRLAPGAFADLIAWERDPFTADATELLEMSPVLVMVDGEVVWSE